MSSENRKGKKAVKEISPYEFGGKTFKEENPETFDISKKIKKHLKDILNE